VRATRKGGPLGTALAFAYAVCGQTLRTLLAWSLPFWPVVTSNATA
jgi:hypothetical protein